MSECWRLSGYGRGSEKRRGCGLREVGNEDLGELGGKRERENENENENENESEVNLGNLEKG